MAIVKGLGKGFDALVPQGTNVDGVIVPKHEKIHHLAIDIVRPRKEQPRQYFDEQSLEQLAQSIREQGVLQPIIVTEVEHNLYTIIAGERRWRAASAAGLQTIPAIVKAVDDLQHLELSLLENVQRADLNAIETAQSIERLHTEFQQSYEDIAKRLGKGYTTVMNAIRLLQLPLEMQQALIVGDISEGHGRALLSLAKDPAAQQKLFTDIVLKKLSVRQAEAYASSVKQGGDISSKKMSPKNDSSISALLSEKLGVTVRVPATKNKGTITIKYSSIKEYDAIIDSLKKM